MADPRRREEEGYGSSDSSSSSNTVSCRYCGKSIPYQGACSCWQCDRDYRSEDGR